MKKYTLRIELKIDSNSSTDAEKLSQLFMKELPRLDNTSILKASLYDNTNKTMINEDIR